MDLRFLAAISRQTNSVRLRQSEDIAFSDVSESSVTWGIELSALIADHVGVWHKACLGEELSQQERIIAGNIYWRIR